MRSAIAASSPTRATRLQGSALLRHPPRAVPEVSEITQGYGAALIARFVADETARGGVMGKAQGRS